MRFPLCFALAAAGAFGFAEGAWLADVPKAERVKISSAFSSLGAIQKRIKEDHADAVRHEALYAKKARFLARSLDIAASAAAQDENERKSLLESLGDQRRLRFESAVDLSERRYGRTGTAGFESAAALEAKLASEGAAFSARMGKLLPKMRRQALSALISDLESRTAAHPDCPKAAFGDLKSAAAGLGAADRRRWALALTPGLPGALPAAFPERLGLAGDGAAPSASPDASFSQALERFKKTLETASAMKASLPAAAAASWYVDSIYGPFPPRAAASVASFAQTLSTAGAEAVARSTAEFPLLAEAIAEYASILWIVRRSDPGALSAEFGTDEKTVEDALRAVWRPAAVPSSGIGVEASPDLPSIRAAERMAMFLEGDPADSDTLAAFAELRTDALALYAFSEGVRYGAARERVARALAAASAEAEKAAVAASRAPIPFLPQSSPFGPIFVAAASDGRVVLPASFAPDYAGSLAASLGLRSGDKTAAARWLASRGVFFTVPCLAESSAASPEELDALANGTCFYPAGDSRGGAAAAALVARRMAADAARIGLPYGLVGSPEDSARRFAAFSSGAARYAGLRRSRKSE
jgi:hypothetical protein